MGWWYMSTSGLHSSNPLPHVCSIFRYTIRMPASSAIDSKDRIMGGGISAVARRKGSVHRLAESWNAGDFGKKESDRRA